MSSAKSCTDEKGRILLDSNDSKKPHVSLLTSHLRRVTEKRLCTCCEHKGHTKKGSFVTTLWHMMTRKQQYGCNPVYGGGDGKVVRGKELLCLLLNTELEMWLRGLITFLITVFIVSF